MLFSKGFFDLKVMNACICSGGITLRFHSQYLDVVTDLLFIPCALPTINYHPQTKSQKGNVLRRVFHSVHRVGACVAGGEGMYGWEK